MNKYEAREILGLQVGPIDKDILKRRYRIIAKKYHPDSCGGSVESERKMSEASEAYRILQNELNGTLVETSDTIVSNTVTVTTVQLNAILKGIEIQTDSGIKLNKNNISFFNVLINFEWFTMYNGKVSRWSQIEVYKPLKVYKLSCEINVNEDKPEIKLKVYNQDRLVRINFNAVSMVIMVEDIQLEITLKKRMVS